MRNTKKNVKRQMKAKLEEMQNYYEEKEDNYHYVDKQEQLNGFLDDDDNNNDFEPVNQKRKLNDIGNNCLNGKRHSDGNTIYINNDNGD